MNSEGNQNSNDIKMENIRKEEYFVDDSRQFDIVLLSQKALTISNLDEFMDELVALVAKSLGTELVKILKLTEDKKRLKLLKGIGWHEGIVGNSYVEMDYTSQAGYTLINNKTIIVRDFEKETRFKAPSLLVTHNVASGLSMVISGLNGPYGVLGAHSTKQLDFNVNDINFFNSVCHVLSAKVIQTESINTLKEEEEKYRTLMEYAGDGIVLSDLKGNLIDVNAKTCAITQYSKAELLKMNAADLYDKQELNRIPLKLDEIKSGSNIILERKMTRKDKTIMPVEISLALLPNKKYIQAIIRDLSERKKTEELLRNIQKMEAITRVGGGLAHDFNNYLTIITGYAETINNAESGTFILEDIKTSALNIKKTTEKASALIKNLLSFSSKNHFENSLINVNLTITELEKSLKSLIGEKIKIKLDLQEELPAIKSNQDQLQQSLINLVINAKDALEQTPKGKITIKTFQYELEQCYEHFAFKAQPGLYIGISVTDNGTGMSDEVKSHLYEPFFTTKGVTKGMGLGLASIYGFMNECNGFMTIDSILNEGTTISMFFKESEEKLQDSKTTAEQGETIEEIHSSSVKTILVVEDNHELLVILTTFLTKKGFKVLNAKNGKEGIELVQKQENTKRSKIDLVISDIVMPIMDGLEMLKAFNELKINKKIILMSGYSDINPMTVDYFQEIHFILKPFSMDKLLQLIQTAD